MLLDVDIAGDHVAFTCTDVTEPGDVYAAGADGAGERRLTDVNRILMDGLELASPEHLDMVGAGGQHVEGWFLTGRGEGRRPLILEIHGGPHALYGNAFFHEFQTAGGTAATTCSTPTRAAARATASGSAPRSPGAGASLTTRI